MANSLLRRYTPPTCTLEIAASESSLSRWAEQPVLKHLRFQLSFDDPRIPEDSRVTVEGDRTHLDALVETVTTYVQAFLHDGMTPLGDPVTNGVAHATGLSVMPQTAPSTSVRTLSNRGIWLEPQGLVSHRLWLGDLANAESGESVRLSTLQLYDLANALEDYAADILVLPSLGRSPWRMPSISWARTAAMLLLAVGVTATMTKFIVDVASPPSSMQTASAPTNQAQESAEPLTLDAPTGSATQPAAPTASPPPVNADLPPIVFPSGTASKPQPNQRPAPAGTAPRQGQAPTAIRPQGGETAQIPALPPLAPVAPQVAIAPPNAAVADAPMAPSEAARTTLAAPAGSAPAATAPSTAFDAVPQVAEARTYMQQRWTPPAGLTQVLEYQLSLNTDGSVRQITPLGQSSWVYLDKTGLPAEGAPFVAPFADAQTPELRLVLNPDGRVQTFLQSLE